MTRLQDLHWAADTGCAAFYRDAVGGRAWLVHDAGECLDLSAIADIESVIVAPDRLGALSRGNGVTWAGELQRVVRLDWDRACTRVAACGDELVAVGWDSGNPRTASVARFDQQGQRIWERRFDDVRSEFVDVVSVVGGMAVLDRRGARVLVLSDDGDILLMAGRQRSCRPDDFGLLGPSRIAAGADHLVVCDTYNHRVLRLDFDVSAGSVSWTTVGYLSLPVAVARRDNGFVGLSGRDGEVAALHATADRIGEDGLLYPRAVEGDQDGGACNVADTAHHRVVHFEGRRDTDNAGVETVRVPGGDNWLWPRAFRRHGDRCFAAFAIPPRVVSWREGAAAPELELTALETGTGMIPLADPHDIALLRDGGFVVVDSEADLVARCNDDGTPAWIATEATVGRPLVEPHAVVVAGDALAVAHAGGICWLAHDGSVVGWSDTATFADASTVAVRHVKGLAWDAVTKRLAVSATFGRRRGLALARRSSASLEVEAFATKVEVGIGGTRPLGRPRGLAFIDGELVVADFEHHEMVFLALDAGSEVARRRL
jgi:hypothetical protein